MTGPLKLRASTMAALAVSLVVAVAGTAVIRTASAEETSRAGTDQACVASATDNADAADAKAAFGPLCQAAGGEVQLITDDASLAAEETLSDGEETSPDGEVTTMAGKKKSGMLLKVPGAKPITKNDKAKNVDLAKLVFNKSKPGSRFVIPAQIRANNSGAVNIFVPKNKVHAELSGWVNSALSAMAGAAVLFIVGGICVAMVGPETGGAGLPGCQALAGGLGAGVGTLVNELLDGKSIKNGDVWGKVVAQATIGAMAGAGWTKFEPWAKTKMPALIKYLSGKVQLFVNTFKYWAGNLGQSSIGKVSGILSGLAPKFYGFLRAAAR